MQQDGRLSPSHGELGFGGPVSWQPAASARTTSPTAESHQPLMSTPFSDYPPSSRRFQTSAQNSISRPESKAPVRPVLNDGPTSISASSHPRRFSKASPATPPRSNSPPVAATSAYITNPITAVPATAQNTYPSPVRAAVNPFQPPPPPPPPHNPSKTTQPAPQHQGTQHQANGSNYQSTQPRAVLPTADHSSQSTYQHQPQQRYQHTTSPDVMAYGQPSPYSTSHDDDEDTRTFLNPAHEARAPLNRPGSIRSDLRPNQPVGAAGGGKGREWARTYPQNPKKKSSNCFCKMLGWTLTIMLAIGLGVGVYVGVKMYRRTKNQKGIIPDRTVDANPADGGPARCDGSGVLSSITQTQRASVQDRSTYEQQPLQTSTSVLHIKFNREVDPILQEVVKAANASVGPNLDLQNLTPQQISQFLTDKFNGAWIDPKYNTWLSELMAHIGPAELDVVKGIKRFYYGSYANVLIVEFDDSISAVQFNSLIALLEAQKGKIQWVQADKQFRQLSTLTRINDPDAKDQWGIQSVGVLAQDGLTVPPAWTVTTGSRSIVVAIMDTGVDVGHPDLQPNLWVNQVEQQGVFGSDDDGNGKVDDIHGWNFVENNAQISDPEGHGTHVAGIIAAVANNGLYGAGVAPVVSIMICKVLNSMGDGWTSTLYQGMEYALEKGAHITSHSLGSTESDPTLEEVVMRAQQQGQLLVAAAGNNRNNNDAKPTYPASYDLDNVISVGWMDQFGCFDRSANYGKKSVHLVAPGTGILSTYPTYRASPINQPGMAVLSGSSQATPHVAGAAALVLASWEAQGKSYQGQARTLKQILLDSVDKDPLFENYTIAGGKLNVGRALALASNTTLPPPSSSSSEFSHTVALLWLSAVLTLVSAQMVL